jgi:hypothetical protein
MLRHALNIAVRDYGVDMVSEIEKGPLAGQTSLDWNQAVAVAASLLNLGWELAETRCDPAGSSEEELAALLCAYGVLGNERKTTPVD